MRLTSATFAFLVACGSSTPAVKTDAPAAETPAETPAATDGKMPLIVSFYSPGNGTNEEASAKLDALVQATQPSPARKTVRWGREGEHDECFKLDDLSAEQRTAFIAAVEKELAGADRVNILKDEPCKEAW